MEYFNYILKKDTMKAILEFNLPEDSSDHEMCINAYRYHNSLYEFKQLLRQKIKYGEHTDEIYDVYEKIRDEFNDILDSNNVNLDI